MGSRRTTRSNILAFTLKVKFTKNDLFFPRCFFFDLFFILFFFFLFFHNTRDNRHRRHHNDYITAAAACKTACIASPYLTSFFSTATLIFSYPDDRCNVCGAFGTSPLLAYRPKMYPSGREFFFSRGSDSLYGKRTNSRLIFHSKKFIKT